MHLHFKYGKRCAVSALKIVRLHRMLDFAICFFDYYYFACGIIFCIGDGVSPSFPR